jgi:hypothetical protein
MEKLLATKKTDLLQFVSARTRRPFQAFLVVQPDGKVGFEFEAKDPTKARGAHGGRPATALKVLGVHPKTKAPVELHSGKYGPYVKHGTVNATLPDRDQVDTVTLEQALELLAAKSGTSAPARPTRAAKKPVKKAAAGAAAKKPAKESVDETATPATARTAKARTAASTTKPAARTPGKKLPAKKSASVRRKKT